MTRKILNILMMCILLHTLTKSEAMIKLYLEPK